MGCGNGVSTVALYQRGAYDRVVGVDISPAAIARAQEAVSRAGVPTVQVSVESSNGVVLICADVLDDQGPLRAFHGACHAVVDCQFYHAVRTPSTAVKVAGSLARLLVPGVGRLLVVCGNIEEPPRISPGPTLLSR